MGKIRPWPQIKRNCETLELKSSPIFCMDGLGRRYKASMCPAVTSDAPRLSKIIEGAYPSSRGGRPPAADNHARRQEGEEAVEE
jgi:hypothetical protein